MNPGGVNCCEEIVNITVKAEQRRGGGDGEERGERRSGQQSVGSRFCLHLT